jgi:hypothetical protein
MKVWLASYPRSGNAFLRMILNAVFGIKSTSVYSAEDSAMAERPWHAQLVGYAGEFRRVKSISNPNEWIAVKTHDPPSDSEPAIYVVHDGRAAIVSYFHFVRAFADTFPPLQDLIEGKVWPGSWSQHLKMWNPKERANTLLLKYEHLKSDPRRCCKEISMFLNIPQKAEFTQEFDELHRLDPSLFRAGNNELNIAEMSSYVEQFDRLHGAVMKQLGYYR